MDSAEHAIRVCELHAPANAPKSVAQNGETLYGQPAMTNLMPSIGCS